MLMIHGRDYTLILLGAAGALLFLAIQLCCCRSHRLWVRLLPLWPLAAGLGYGTALWIGTLGRYSVGVLSGNQLAGTVVWIVVGIASVGDALGWILWVLGRWMRKK